MKYDWRKEEKELYVAPKVPALINVPKQNYIRISGKGNPNEPDFSERVSVLYSLAYAIKMNYKSLAVNKDICDFSVYPLEGVWKKKEDKELVKEKLEYTIMIRQPNFITGDMVNTALEKVKKKKPNLLFENISFQTIQEEMCIQILHIGSYDDEPVSFEKMDGFAKREGFERIEDFHREIYLNNANRVHVSNMKTILRYQVKQLQR